MFIQSMTCVHSKKKNDNKKKYTNSGMVFSVRKRGRQIICTRRSEMDADSQRILGVEHRMCTIYGCFFFHFIQKFFVRILFHLNLRLKRKRAQCRQPSFKASVNNNQPEFYLRTCKTVLLICSGGGGVGSLCSWK